MSKINLKSLSYHELSDWILSLGEKSFRASQIWLWLYHKNLSEFTGMTNISRQFQNTLKERAFIFTLPLSKTTNSRTSQTRKYLWKLNDGNHIESVYIPEGKRKTFCISSQVGCAVGCRFCATAEMGFIRNLEVHEIVEQVLAMQRHTGIRPTNLVVMGMGEPLLNYNNVMKALWILNHQDGLAIGHRKVTVSTSGIVPIIEQYIRDRHPFNLAVSLNAADNETRSGIMPINRKYPLDSLIRAVKLYARQSRKRVTFEYVLIKGVNDSPEDAHRLLNLLSGIRCKVNLIAYNPVRGPWSRPDDQCIHAFAEIIRPLCAPVTLRLSKGDDINAACGQLATTATDRHGYNL
ncbi:23S rRNA (adenine(2503)-C(2))-methyltransferase RlmN [bacterium]|nr:23S rRNA (adenine(2503)-C(2))-methyltransferase RlmN [bacterium]